MDSRAARSPARFSVWQRSRSDLIALAVITLVVIIFFAPVLFGGYWLPNGGGDLAVFLWPTYSYAAHTLKSGQLPLWNPHLYSGAPFWADNQSSILYPPTLLVMLLTGVPYQALEGLVIFHIWLAGAAMYVCLRGLSRADLSVPGSESQRSPSGVWNLELLPALLGATLWMLSDGLVTHIGNLNLIAAAAWLPLVLLGAWRALHDLDWRWAFLGGAGFGLALLAGHAQVAYFTALLIGGVGAWHIGAEIAQAARTRHALPLRDMALMIGLTGLVVFIGLGLSAGSWLPSLEMTAQTGRAGLSYQEAAQFSLPPQALIGLVAPWVYGRGPAGFHGNWDRVEVGYIGAVGLALSLAGAWIAFRRRSGLGIFLTLVAVLSFLVALGKYAPIHQLAYDLLPGFRNFRAPARIILLMNFAQAILAALAFSRGLAAPWRRGQAAAMASIASPPKERRASNESRSAFPDLKSVFPYLVFVLAASELIAFGMTTEIDLADPLAGFNHPEAVAWLAAQPDRPFRIDTAPSGLWQSDLAAIVGDPLYDIYGVSNPLSLASYEGYYWSVGHRGSPTYNFLGARYVISDGPPPADATFKPVAHFADGLTIYQNTRSLPLALLVTHAVPVESQAQASELAHAPDWDARLIAYVEGGPALDVDSTSGGSLAYTEYGPNRIVLRVSASVPVYLVMSEVYYPGWQAAIDGQPVPIYRANAAFRAIYMSQPGEHTVTLDFRPSLVYIGLVISGVSLIAALVLVVRIFTAKTPGVQRY